MAETKKEPGTQVAAWQAELNAMTVATQETEKPSSNWASFRSGILKINDMQMKDNKAPIVVLQSLFENQWYKDKFDPNNPATPHCFAFAERDEDLAPHPDSLSPQAESCAVCPKNAWKSDPDGGKGKACKNVRRIAFISAADTGNAKAEVVFAKLPVMSVKNWSSYASQIANVLKLPPLAVVTEMQVSPDAKSQFQVNFALVDKVHEEHIPNLLSKRKEMYAAFTAPYDKPVEAPTPEAKKY